ncbi:hypothetical protein AAFH68_30490 [Flavobacterium sp. CGRL1]
MTKFLRTAGHTVVQAASNFQEKKVALAISLGLKEEHLQHGTIFKYTLEELTRPFEALFDYIKADYKPFFAYYGMTFEPSEEWIERSVPLYLDFLENFNSAE